LDLRSVTQPFRPSTLGYAALTQPTWAVPGLQTPLSPPPVIRHSLSRVKEAAVRGQAMDKGARFIGG